ncbi:OadG family transporter subunit [Williamwhitmania taraxaci]|uniref:Lamin Tail Domain n=1 Tax=Williamwhitmania taraxaci TaxID=1640674 RepID=A0A1G6GLY7_9BACT|nr:OadG family transporter subunit [Williamwhitmania taraxaci]SDB83028.1 Lamin Tail Domain [Williamwhitmania taraxaci]
MKLVKKLAFTLGLFTLTYAGFAQSARDLRINEVLLINNSSYVDNFGSRSAWVELFNTAYNKVNVAGCYFTDDMSNPTKYRIPTKDQNTVVETRSFTIFFADGKTTHGTFHLNFKMDSTSKFIALFDGDGRTLIDSMSIPQQTGDISFGRIADGDVVIGKLDKTTPMATNITEEMVSPGTRFAAADPIGIGMAISAMSVVFTALMLLYLFFKFIGKANMTAQVKKSSGTSEVTQKEIQEAEISGDVIAAISAALYLYETELHDQESTILTINRVTKTYSPWSSKIYGLRQMPPLQTRKPEFNR